MSISVLIDGVPVTHGIPPESITLSTKAELGAAGTAEFLVEDPSGTFTCTGFDTLVIEETACSQPRMFTGWITERTVGRSPDRALIANGSNSRLWKITAVDVNEAFHLRMLRAAESNRPEETWAARLTWLLGSQFLSSLIADTGYVAAYSLTMDASDYRGSYPTAVLDDLVGRKSDTQLNYFGFFDTATQSAGLFFRGQADAVLDSTLRISNLLSDVDGSTTFAPYRDAELSREPNDVYSGVTVVYGAESKRVFRSRATTASNYINRTTLIRRPFTQQASTAQTQAEAFLNNHGNELDRITCTVRVPASKAGLIRAGERVTCKFTHLPGFGSAWMSLRVLTCTAHPTDGTATTWDLDLELANPRPASSESGGGGGGPCSGGPYDPDDATHNIAYGKTVTMATDSGRTITTASNATDGNLGTVATFEEGVFGAGTFHDVYTVDLGSSQVVNAVSVNKQGGWGDAADWSILVSDSSDGSSGSTAGTKTSSDPDIWTPTYFTQDWMTFRPSATATGRYIHLRRDWVRPGLGYDSGSEVREICVCGGEADDIEDIGPPGGGTVRGETPTPVPTGSQTLFTTGWPYQPGSLTVYVDGNPIPSSEVTETDPSAGQFTLSWAPDADEQIVCTYNRG